MAKTPTSSSSTSKSAAKKPDFDPTNFEQKEPTPEAAPANAKVTPPLEQLNPAAARAVGSSGDPSVVVSDDDLAEATEAHQESVKEALDSATDDDA